MGNRGLWDGPGTGVTAPPTILVSAGDPSADRYLAAIVGRMKQINPSIRWIGLGGPAMAEAGVNILVPQKEVAVVGFREIFTHWGSIRRAMKEMSALIDSKSADLVLLVDFPGFNFRMGKLARKKGLPVVYFIAPQVWAWRSGRMKTMAQFIDRLLVILPFEEELFREAGINTTYVGHPLIEAETNIRPREKALKEAGLEPGHRVVGLLPGSRQGEISHHLPLLLATVDRIRTVDPTIQFFLLRAPGVPEEWFSQAAESAVSILPRRGDDLLAAADVLLGSSGTVTLEAALAGTPMVVCYRLNPISYLAAKILVDVPHVSLPNLLVGEEIMPEFIQREASPENLARAVLEILEIGKSSYQKRFDRLREILGNRLTSPEVAGILGRFMEQIQKKGNL